MSSSLVTSHLYICALDTSKLTSFNAFQCECNASLKSFQCLATNLSISHTGLHISRRWILRASVVTSMSLLRAVHPQTLRHRASSPPLVHWRHHWLRSARLPRASAASYDAAQDQKQQKTADTTAYPDDEVAIVMNPAANLFSSTRPFTLTLSEVSHRGLDVWKARVLLTLLHFPPPPHTVPSRKFCCIL